MEGSSNIQRIVAVVLVIFAVMPIMVASQSCKTQRGLPKILPYKPLVCDGDSGGTQLSVFPARIAFEYLCCRPKKEKVLGYPEEIIPDKLELILTSKDDGDIDKNSTFILLDSNGDGFKTLVYARPGDRKMFRKWFNILQVFVRQFETGNCPVDNKGQKFKQLAVVRGSLHTLASIFLVKDCSGGNIG